MTVHTDTTTIAPRAPQASGSLRTAHVQDATDFEDVFTPRAECIQLSAGPFHGELRQLRIKGVSICLLAANRGIEVRRTIAADRVAIAYADRTETLLANGRALSSDRFLLVSSGDVDVSSVGAAGMTWIDIDLTFLRQSEAGPLLRGVRGRRVLDSTHNALANLRAYVGAAFRMCAAAPLILDNDAVCASIEAELLRRIDHVVAGADEDPTPLKRERKDFGLVRRVERFMWENAEEPLTLESICANTACRTRTLNYSFKKCFGVGPISYLKMLRLNAVRRRLKERRGDVRIFDVAADFGFWHMGHFSTDYKRMFGMTASETVADARALDRRTAIASRQFPDDPLGAPRPYPPSLAGNFPP